MVIIFLLNGRVSRWTVLIFFGARVWTARAVHDFSPVPRTIVTVSSWFHFVLGVVRRCRRRPSIGPYYRSFRRTRPNRFTVLVFFHPAHCLVRSSTDTYIPPYFSAADVVEKDHHHDDRTGQTVRQEPERVRRTGRRPTAFSAVARRDQHSGQRSRPRRKYCKLMTAYTSVWSMGEQYVCDD